MVQQENKSFNLSKKMLHLKIIAIIVVKLTWNVVWNIFIVSFEVAKEKYYHNAVNKLINTKKNSKA